jgi:hypothetical protein
MWEAQVIVAHMLFLGYKCKYFFEILTMVGSLIITSKAKLLVEVSIENYNINGM